MREFLKGIVGAVAFGLCHTAIAATLCVNPGGSSGCRSTISAAVAAASAGDVIQVAGGYYKDDVVIRKSLSLIGAGREQTIIDASGKSNGIFIDGTASSPQAGVSGVVISGFTIQDANFEGILSASATGVTILKNHVTNNNLSLTSTSCPGIPAFETSEAMDCGEGIHLMGTDHSIVEDNLVDRNSGGILTSDETGPSHNNLIAGNTVELNGYACGITMASHPAAALAHPTSGLSFGVYNNTVSANQSRFNGLSNDGGAGTGVFAPGPGARAYGNVIIGNTLTGNAHPGVAMHNHASIAGAPAITFRDNFVIGNFISGNGADTGPGVATSGPTGINVVSVFPITGIVIADNVIEDESLGVSFNSMSTGPNAGPQMQVHLNALEVTGAGISDLGAAKIDATLNWWGCGAGPGAAGCGTTTSGVTFTPWLTSVPRAVR